MLKNELAGDELLGLVNQLDRIDLLVEAAEVLGLLQVRAEDDVRVDACLGLGEHLLSFGV